MSKILDFKQMNDILNSLKKIKKEKPIGYTDCGYSIDHYVYGVGNNHVIFTSGTHAAELISNVFLIRFMEKLEKEEIFIDPNLYTLHFIPIVNPEGTIIVTSAIRSLISRDVSDSLEQTYALTYYCNSLIEDNYNLKYNDNGLKLQQLMFRHADINCIDDEHEKLKNNLKKLFQKYHYDDGILINWSSNSRGVDLNANVGCGSFVKRVIEGENIYASMHLSNIRRDLPGPVGCPFYDNPKELEKENEALLNFYQYIKNNKKLSGSFIYHSCGNLVYYLGEAKEENPWNKNYNMMEKNKIIAEKYAESTGYKLDGMDYFTTFDAMLKTLFPVTLLIELGGVRATPLSQFMDLNLENSDDNFKFVYTKIIEDNTMAILKTLPLMIN